MNSKIKISGVRQNNLKNINLEIDTNDFIAITGVSGSGKSSLSIDTLYAEGQNRYLETFSTYARQVINSINRPKATKIEGVMPSILISQNNNIRLSHSTVGNITELCDYIKLFFVRHAKLFCKECHSIVEKHNPESIFQDILHRTDKIKEPKIAISFDFPTSINIKEDILNFLANKGYLEILEEKIIKDEDNKQEYFLLNVIQDRLNISYKNRNRFIESIGSALSMGKGIITIHLLNNNEKLNSWKYSNSLYCTNCDIKFNDVNADNFSFSSALGGCVECNGFGNKIVIDINKVIPDNTKSLSEGAIKPWRTDTFKICQEHLEKYALINSIPLSIPWKDLKNSEKDWVINGDSNWKNDQYSWNNLWYGIKNFFEDLEKKSYKMHIRILLSKYKKLITCPKCKGHRFKEETLLWRINFDKKENSNFFSKKYNDIRNQHTYTNNFNIAEVLNMSVEKALDLFQFFKKENTYISGDYIPLKEILSRLETLNNIGVGYLTINRQSKTLSGGELQRINLTTALGSSLINTLFVIDEPSNGLHYFDIQKIITSIKQLRESGNCIIVLEHNSKVILSANRVIEMGPGSGKDGGEIIFDGTPYDLIKANTNTSKNLINSFHVEEDNNIQPCENNIIIGGACANNLKKINVTIPLNKLVCITGVSGSGKSSLVEDVIYNSIINLREQPFKKPKNVEYIKGIENISNLLLIDSSPIVNNQRSTVVSYLGLFDIIKNVFAKTKLSIDRNYKASTFSMMSGEGRCPECQGMGFKKIHMQFISDVYIKCTECEGKCFRDEILDVKIEKNDQKYSIHQVLNMTAKEAITLFENNNTIRKSLSLIISLGLEHLTLGKSISIISNGELKRLKLAKYLCKTDYANKDLILLDEPTAGLHINEIHQIIKVIKKIVNNGNSIIAVDHNLHLINSADWICDLGPNGGENGGEIIATGTPTDIKKVETSQTGRALIEYNKNINIKALEADLLFNKQYKKEIKKDFNSIKILNAYENNLKNINIELPLGEFIAITGVSGSGKSTLAFDILFKEGQRSYLMTMNAYARYIINVMKKANVGKIINLPPTAAISQKLNSVGNKSTVGTISEVNSFIRLLYARLGVQHCYKCNSEIDPITKDQIKFRITKLFKNKNIIFLSPIRENNISSLSKENNIYIFDKERLNNNLTYLHIGTENINENNWLKINQIIDEALDYSGGFIKIIDKSANTDFIFSIDNSCLFCNINYPKIDSTLFSFNSKKGWCTSCHGTGLAEDKNSMESFNKSTDLTNLDICKECEGKRLNKTALSVLWKNHNIDQIFSMSINCLLSFLKEIKLNAKEKDIAQVIIKEILKRLDFMKSVGIGYLNLNRSEPTLSGGESQRVNLSSRLGSESQGICYILDEPTIGLHPHNNKSLIDALIKLKDQGNTVVVVEHDQEIIRNASHIIEIGPGAGSLGGKIVAQGTLDELLRNNESIFVKSLKKINKNNLSKINIPINVKFLEIEQAILNNINNINVKFPIGLLSVVTGISGSGKSTIIQRILLPNIRSKIKNKEHHWINCKNIKEYEKINRILSVDQTPIGKNSRSCPATFIGFWDEIRKIFANTNDAKIRGWSVSRFSFNCKEGRCEECKGTGTKIIEMNFLSNAETICEHCQGTRFNNDTKTIEFLNKNIGDILTMSVDEALITFANFPKISRPLKLMQDIGLGYLPIGQQSSHLSGGEAQRIKIVTELSKIKNNSYQNQHSLYILDEPTIGLSSNDVQKLINILSQLVALNNTVIVIEHNLEFISQSDWIIDMGPEGGEDGGKVVFQGTIKNLIESDLYSHTKNAINEFINNSI